MHYDRNNEHVPSYGTRAFMNFGLLQNVCFTMVTLGGIGTRCYAPGTVATCVTLLGMYLISFFSLSLTLQCLLTALCIIIGYLCINAALPLFFNKKDPSAIVIDELIGTCITFIGTSVSLHTVIIGFIAFRLFDIYKPCGITKLESLSGARGIIADDVVAGLCACLIVHCHTWLFV